MSSSTNDSISLNSVEDIVQIVTSSSNASKPLESAGNSVVKLVDDVTGFYFEILVYILLSGLVSIVGIGANVTNIIIFTRQGIFSDGGSPSLLCLAVSDLCCVTSMLWLSITFAVVHADPSGLSWKPWDIMYLTGGWPHLMFAQITRMVTAYVALERCICVVFPFKVKSVFTPKRTLVVVAGIFVAFALSYSPVFITQQLEFKFDLNTNTTRLVLVFSPRWQLALDAMYYINSIAFNIGAVAIVLVCTVVTVSGVNLSKAWRESFASESKATKSQQDMPNKMSKSKIQKERKLVRMIIMISTIFLICYIPDFCFMLMFTAEPEIRVLGQQKNLAMVMYSFTFLMETFNSTINIIVYFKMSSRYKQDFLALFELKLSSAN